MKASNLQKRFQEITQQQLTLITHKNGYTRLDKLFETAREDLSLAKLAEAHWDALSILAEGGRKTDKNKLYGVWASEIPGKPLEVTTKGKYCVLNGTKMFCSGAGLIDRTLITAGKNSILIDLDLRERSSKEIQIDSTIWQTRAFKATQTSRVTFNKTTFNTSDIIGKPGWYLKRVGFWHGALGPAACWGGGAAGLLDYAFSVQRSDSHTLAHLAAMDANIWAIKSLLQTAASEIINAPQTYLSAQQLALKTRHLIEQLCTDTLRRFARSYGPFPLACNNHISRQYQELDLFLRQNHGERDLEKIGKILKKIP